MSVLFLLPCTSGLLLHKTEIVDAWGIYSYSNQPFTFVCSYFYSLINPLQSGFCFSCASWLLPSWLMMSLMLNLTNKCHPAHWSSQLHSLELSTLPRARPPWHCFRVVFLLPSWPPLPTNPPLNIDIPPVMCLQPFLLAFYTFSQFSLSPLCPWLANVCVPRMPLPWAQEQYAQLSTWHTPWTYKYLKMSISKTKLLIQFPNLFFSKVLCLLNGTTSCYN